MQYVYSVHQYMYVFAIHVLMLNGKNGKMFLNYLKKIHTVSSTFSVNGSMLYISIKKTINFCFMEDIFLFLHCIFFFYNIR